jgi:hypothetical protein
MKYDEFEASVEGTREALGERVDAAVDAALEAAARAVADLLNEPGPQRIFGVTYPTAGKTGVAAALTAGLAFLADKFSWLPL